MDFAVELWKLAQQAGPFASAFLLTALWWMNEERKIYKEKYDKLQERYLQESADNRETLKEIRTMFEKAITAK